MAEVKIAPPTPAEAPKEEPKKELTFLQQLMYLKGMTVRAGVIHEAQAIQIRNWPLLIPGIKSATAHVDTNRKVVSYICVPKSPLFKNTKHVKTICHDICKFIKTILWDETSVVFSVDKRIIFDSRTDYEQPKD